MHPTRDAETAPAREVALFVRSLSPSGARERQATVRERLQSLARGPVVEDVCVSVWGEQVGLHERDGQVASGTGVRGQIEALRSWADEHGRTLEPFIETRQRRSTVTGADDTVLVLPVMSLVEYRDGDVCHVTPSADGDEVYTVVDRVETLEATASPRPTA